MKLVKKPANTRGDCRGCVCYHPEKPRHVFGMGTNRRWCSNGSFHAPEECYEEQIIYVETPS
jgi:hypothetical protein